MRKFLLFLVTGVVLYSCISSKSQKEREKKENGKYDNPMVRDQQAADMLKDPALGFVPYDRLMKAVDQTIDMKMNGPFPTTPGSIAAPLNWQERGPIYDSVGPSNGNGRGGGTGSTAGGHTSGRIRAFLLDTLNDPTGNTAFCGGVAGGLWKTTNFLSTVLNWAPVNDRFDNLAISSICQDPTNPSVIYFSTGEPTDNADRVTGAGVWKSTDKGVSFSFLPATANFMRGFKIGCDVAGNVYLACRTHTTPVNQPNGLFRSTNGGTTWTNITPSDLSANSNLSCTDFEFTTSGNLNAMFGYRPTGNVVNHRYTTSPATVAPGTWSAGAGFRVSNAAAIRTEMGVAGNILYAITVTPGYATDSCYKSIDAGVTWTKQNTVVLPTGLGSGQGWYNLSLAVNPSNPDELISGGLDAFRSVNSGATWTRFTNWVSTAPYVHADHHYAQYWITAGQTRMILATDGGIFYSANNGTNFTSKNQNLGIKQFYAGAIHPAAGSPVLLAGAQDNGTHQLRNPGLSYSIEVTGGDGCIVHINQQNPLIQFGSYVYNQYRRTVNGGATWSSVNLSGSQGLFVNPFDHDDGQNIMYCSNGPLGQLRRWTSTNTSSTNTVITMSNIGATTSMTAVKLSPFTANRLFFGTNTGKVFRLENANTVVTADANTNLTDITGTGFPAGTIICVNTGTDDNNIVATYSNYGVNNVWVTTNGGTSWSAIDGNLADMPVRWAMFQPGSNSKLFLATEAGIYTTTSISGAATQWAPETTFPTVSTYMLKMRASDSTIVAATHGRGLWTAKIAACISGLVTTQPANTSGCAGSSAIFTVAASGVLSYQWQVSTNGGASYSDILNATTATLTIPATTAAMNGNRYRAVMMTDCAATLTSDGAILTVNPAPAISLSASPFTRLFPGLNTTLSASSLPAAASYAWFRNGTLIPGATTSTLPVNVDGLGSYTVRITDVNGCSNTSTALSIADSVSGRVFIYPSPNDGRFQVRYYSAPNNVLVRGVFVYNAKGQRILMKDFTNTAPYSRMDIDLRPYSKGVYWIEVVDANAKRLAMGRTVTQ
jgi:trimeric autotransporter adhesin